MYEEFGADWPSMLPYAQCVLRILPLKSLGGRSPYKVVTGVRPKFPTAFIGEFPVREVTVDEYAEGLMGHLREVYRRIKKVQEDAVEGTGVASPREFGPRAAGG